MAQDSTNGLSVVVGIDVGDKTSLFSRLGSDGRVEAKGSVPTTRKGLERQFGDWEPCRMVIEAGSHSMWMESCLKEIGHEVIVANPRRLALIFGDLKKNDEVDAEKLARLGRADPELLYPVQHRSQKCQADLAVIKARGVLVEVRTKLINHIRSTSKGFGVRLPSCSAAAFVKKVGPSVPKELKIPLTPLVSTLAELEGEIRSYDKKIELLGEKQHPETSVLRQVTGVGPITALAYILTLEDPGRFPDSRTVGAFLGLTPRQDRSGDRNPQLPITKAGNKDLRRLLITSAHYILGWRGPDCQLRRYGERIAERGGKSAKKRAVVAVARKLCVLLHRLWKNGEVYDPEYAGTSKRKRRKAS